MCLAVSASRDQISALDSVVFQGSAQTSRIAWLPAVPSRNSKAAQAGPTVTARANPRNAR